jgi:hypothetical protein
MNVAELKDRAKELGIKGADGMKKAELEAAIAAAESESAGSGQSPPPSPPDAPPPPAEDESADKPRRSEGSPDGSKHVPPKLYRIS